MFTKMHKKNWLSPDNQSLTNLKSNTMKNNANVFPLLNLSKYFD